MNQKLSVEQICRNLRPILGGQVDDLYFKYAMSESAEARDDVVHVLNALYHKNLGELLDNRVLLEPPKFRLGGEYPLGKISYAGKDFGGFNLREGDWSRHVCISGMSGSGKTTLAINLVKNFIDRDKPFLVFDWKKSFRPLLLAGSEVMCLTVGESKVSNFFKMNINRPPKGVEPREWINVLCDLLVESFSASFGVHKVLLETLDDAFKQWRIYEGSENYPTWENIKWYLEEKFDKASGREAGWVESALRIASVLTFGNFGEVCCSKEGGVSVEDVMDKQVILELNSLSNVEKKFFCEFILTYVYKFKKANSRRVSGFDHAIVVDEAHNVFLKSSTNFVRESVTDMVYREMREYGTSLICIDQHVSKLSDTVKGNSACHIAFGQQLPADIYDIAGLMQLGEQRQFFSQLPVGSAIVKLSERYSFPFLIEVTKSGLADEIVSDERVRSRANALISGRDFEKKLDENFNKKIVANESAPLSGMAPKPVDVKIHYDRVEVEKVHEPMKSDSAEDVLYGFAKKKLADGFSLAEVEKVLEENKVKGGYSSDVVTGVINRVLCEGSESKCVGKGFDFSGFNLNDDESRFVNFLCKNNAQEYGVVDVYGALGLSARKGNNIKNSLIEKNLICLEEVRNEKGWKKIIRLAQPIHVH